MYCLVYLQLRPQILQSYALDFNGVTYVFTRLFSFGFVVVLTEEVVTGLLVARRRLLVALVKAGCGIIEFP